MSNKKSKPLAIFCNPDHTHILIGLHLTISISDMDGCMKSNSSKLINEKRFVMGKFNWQEGFEAFTYSKSEIDSVVKLCRSSGADRFYLVLLITKVSLLWSWSS